LLESKEGCLGISSLKDTIQVDKDASIIAEIAFSGCFKYSCESDWKDDFRYHCIPFCPFPNNKTPMYGWKISLVRKVTFKPKLLARVFRSFFNPVLQVPIIDITIVNDDTIAAIEKQWEKIGFLRITFDGFPKDVVEKAHHVGKLFFSQDIESKTKASKSAIQKKNDSFCSTGYRATGDAYNAGGRESWSCIRPDYISSVDKYFNNTDGRKHFAQPPDPQVPWPSEDLVGGFKQTITAYYKEMEKLSLILFRIFEKILNLKEYSLIDLAREHTSSLYLSNFITGHKGEEVLAAHADITCFTILSHDVSDDAAGTSSLQVLDPDSCEDYPWISLAQADPFSPPSFLINLGQIMERWSNGRLKATLHRVVRSEITETSLRRQGFVYFQNTNYHTMLNVLDHKEGMENEIVYTQERMDDYSNSRISNFYSQTPKNEAYAIYNRDVVSRLKYLNLIGK
jgi:isopenicillin N synthase-like dioxygenase